MAIIVQDITNNKDAIISEINDIYNNRAFGIDDTILYFSEKNNKRYEIPFKYLEETYAKSNGVSIAQKYDLITKMYDMNIICSERNLKEGYKAIHKDKVDKFLKNFKYQGDLKAKYEFKEKTKKKLSLYFENDNKFHGRIPKIIDSMCAVADNYGLKTERIYNAFSIPNVSKLLASGLSEMETTLLFTVLKQNELSNLLNNLKYGSMIVKLLDEGYNKKDYNYINAASFICTHLQSDEDLLKKVAKHAEYLKIDDKTTINGLKAQFSKIKSLSEKEKVEKADKKPGFKFKNCRCDLKYTSIDFDKYHCEILKADDTRAFTIGYDTDCCQVLGDAGESSMMHGLLNPKAGFWILTNKNTDKVLAQAEIWEENENTLVFDNIEFANDADISLYKDAIGKWLLESEYPNIKMGTGWNEMNDGTLRTCGSVRPTITAYEAYVLSYEKDAEIPEFYERTAPNKREDDNLYELESVEKAQQLLNEGRIDYYDYVYCDSENEAVFMKENGIVEPFFQIDDIRNINNDISFDDDERNI